MQTLATLLMTYVQWPSLRECGLVAKALVGKCEFLKDDVGDGEVSEQYSYSATAQNIHTWVYVLDKACPIGTYIRYKA